MKKTTCLDLRGACATEIQGATPEEMGKNSQRHVMEMVQAGDAAHQAAVESMRQLSPAAQQQWFADFQQRFESLPDV